MILESVGKVNTAFKLLTEGAMFEIFILCVVSWNNNNYFLLLVCRCTNFLLVL